MKDAKQLLPFSTATRSISVPGAKPERGSGLPACSAGGGDPKLLGRAGLPFRTEGNAALTRARRLQRPHFFCASFAQSTSFWLAPSLAAAAQKGSEGMCACVYQAELGARRRTPQSGDWLPWPLQELVPSSRAHRQKAPLAKGPDERPQKAAAPPTRRGLTLRQVGGLARECNPSPPKQPLVPETGLKNSRVLGLSAEPPSEVPSRGFNPFFPTLPPFLPGITHKKKAEA